VRYDASIQTPADTSSDLDHVSKDFFLIGYNECFEETVQVSIP
jgi:hypothetical protein